MPYRTLRLVLFRSGTDQISALRDSQNGIAVPVRDDLPFGATLLLAPTRIAVPRWLEYVSDAAAAELPHVRNQANGALLLLSSGTADRERLFGFTFGNGRTLLALDRIEHDFGLRVVLNSVDPDRLRAVESKVFDELVLHTSRQASRYSPTGTFDIDDTRDLLRAVAGIPRDRTLGRRLAGSDSLVISSSATIQDLGDLTSRLLELYESEDYREAFEFIDHVRLVRDDATISRLEGALERVLRSRDIPEELVHLAPPEVIDFNTVDGFLYPGETRGRSELHEDLNLADFLAVVGREAATVTALRKWRIRAIGGDGQELRAWSAFSCLVHEAPDDGRLYMLSEGQWFQVQRQFAAEIDAAVDAIPRVELAWPTAGPDESEQRYNQRVVDTVPGTALFDRIMISVPGARTPIEACDVFDGDHLVHVKRRTTSATLSHLFAQGRVAAEAFRFEPGVREQMRNHLGAGHPLLETVPVDEPEHGRHQVVYAIVAANAARLPRGLPFFSKLNLARTARAIFRELGFRVGIASIEER